MSGPKGSVFEPLEYQINLKKGDKCQDLVFKLKGFSLNIPTKIKTSTGSFVKGPTGIPVELWKKGKSIASTTTNTEGIAIFDEVTTPDLYEVRIINNEDTTF